MYWPLLWYQRIDVPSAATCIVRVCGIGSICMTIYAEHWRLLLCVWVYIIYQTHTHTHTHTPSFTSEWQLIEIDWDSIEPGRERRRRRRRISKRGWNGMCTSCAAINIVQRSMRQSMEMQPVDSHRQAPYYSLELHFFVYVYTKRYASSGLSILLHWAHLVIVCTIPTSSFRPLYWLIPIANER